MRLPCVHGPISFAPSTLNCVSCTSPGPTGSRVVERLLELGHSVNAVVLPRELETSPETVVYLEVRLRSQEASTLP